MGVSHTAIGTILDILTSEGRIMCGFHFRPPASCAHGQLESPFIFRPLKSHGFPICGALSLPTQSSDSVLVKNRWFRGAAAQISGPREKLPESLKFRSPAEFDIART
jgi:hypothetical protein